MTNKWTLSKKAVYLLVSSISFITSLTEEEDGSFTGFIDNMKDTKLTIGETKLQEKPRHLNITAVRDIFPIMKMQSTFGRGGYRWLRNDTRISL